ncbi:hypothetical protein [Arthrobacter sp. NicSoilB11]|nr:hypothetical protein [Arthrobacter sp. NicSoilB11]BCW75023.1 hypothetical protein NicSoilB11_13480 [Arthrobacter sp. NicSoilB11]
MDSASHARRIAAGPLPSELLGAKHGVTPAVPSAPPGSGPDNAEAPPFDPLRLCIFATVALLGWLAGPVALSVFAAIGFIGYWKARRRGLMKSKCYLRDTRLVLSYLGVLLAAGIYGIYLVTGRLFGV